MNKAHSGVGLLLTLCVVLLLASQSSATPTLQLGTAAIQRGGSTTLPLSLTGDTGTFAGVNAKVLLPTGITCSSVTRGGGLSTDFSVDSAPLSGTEHGVAVIAYSGTATFTAGEVLNLALSAAADAPLGADLPVTFDASKTDVVVNAKYALSDATGAHSLALNPVGGTISVTVNTAPVLHIEPLQQSVGAAQGSTSFAVSNVGGGTMAWTAAVVAGGDWLTLTAGGSGTDAGTIACTYQANTGAQSRTSRITVSVAGGSSADVLVVQAPPGTPVLSVSPGTQPVASSSGSTSFAVSNVGAGTMNWSAAVTAGSDWLSIGAGGAGTNAGSITVNFAQNVGTVARTGAVTVTAPGAVGSPVTVNVYQAAPAVLSVTPSNRPVDAKAGNTTFGVTNTGTGTMNWSAAVTVGSDWLSIGSGSNGSNAGTITANFSQNTGTATRVGTITVTAAGAVGSPATITVTQSACSAPEDPASIQASDGNFTDKVQITWDAVDGATAYEVYRSDSNDSGTAILLGSPSNTHYDDTTAAAPTNSKGSGCFGKSSVTNHEYYYWVKAKNDCGSSDFSASDQGYRGAASSKVYEKSLPAVQGNESVARVGNESELAIRLMADAPIDPSTVWGKVRGASFETEVVDWLPTGADESTDGWVVYKPAQPWPVGETVSFTVGGRTISGKEIDPIAADFLIDSTETVISQKSIAQPSYKDLDTNGLSLDAEATDLLTIAEQGDSASIPELLGAIGPVYRLGPEQPFTLPQRVWLPLPAGTDTKNLAVYYYHVENGESGWYSAEDVEGWLVPDSYLQVTVNSTTYLGFLVRHSGVVQLGLPPESLPSTQGASVVFTTRSAWGDIAVFALVCGMFFAVQRVRKEAR